VTITEDKGISNDPMQTHLGRSIPLNFNRGREKPSPVARPILACGIAKAGWPLQSAYSLDRASCSFLALNTSRRRGSHSGTVRVYKREFFFGEPAKALCVIVLNRKSRSSHLQETPGANKGHHKCSSERRTAYSIPRGSPRLLDTRSPIHNKWY
jgi:hypothetical protein